jgi:hypothetical protein
MASRFFKDIQGKDISSLLAGKSKFPIFVDAKGEILKHASIIILN